MIHYGARGRVGSLGNENLSRGILSLRGVMDGVFVSLLPPYSYVETLNPNVAVFGDRASQRTDI